MERVYVKNIADLTPDNLDEGKELIFKVIPKITGNCELISELTKCLVNYHLLELSIDVYYGLDIVQIHLFSLEKRINYVCYIVNGVLSVIPSGYCEGVTIFGEEW